MKGLIFKWWWVTWGADIEQHTSYVRMYVHTAAVWRRGGDVGVAYVLCVPQYLYLIWVGSLTDLSLYVYHCLLCAPRSKGTWDKLLTEFYVCASWVTSLFNEQVEHTHSITVTAIVMETLTQWLIHTLSDFIHFRLQNCIYICKYIFGQFPWFGSIYTKKICCFRHIRQWKSILLGGAIGFNIHCQLSKALQAVLKWMWTVLRPTSVHTFVAV